ncbi:hypothetical protein ACWGJP_08240 [Microbacterium sp. NPDC055903]
MAARQSAAVYRRRRLVVALAALLVLALVAAAVWLLIARPWEAAEPTATPTSTSVDTPTPSGTPTTDAPTPNASESPGVVACEASDILVEAVTDAESYAEGALPELSISLTNTGSSDCTINVGTTTQQFVITSGEDTWWRSTDCQENPSDQFATLKAGETVTSAEPVVWDRTRSSVDSCDQENRPRAPGGGASYHVAVSIGGFDSTATRQFILS